MFIIQCVILNVMSKVAHNNDGMVGLQNCVDILRSEPGPCTGTCQVSSGDGNQVIGKKVPESAYMKVEDDPGPTAPTGIEIESAVSLCVCVCWDLCTLDQ